MNTETLAAPGAAAEITAPESVEAEVTEQQTGKEPEQTTEVDPVKALEQRLEKERQRFDRRINRKHAEAAQAMERARQLEERLAALERPATPESEALDPAEIERAVTQRAEQLTRVREVAARSNRTFEDGLKEFGDAFKASIAALIEDAGPLIGGDNLPTALGEAILDSDKPHQLLHYLGQNPDIAESLNGLSATKLGRALDRIERDMETARVSKAPAPLKPVTPKGAPAAKAESEMTDAEWYAQRRKR